MLPSELIKQVRHRLFDDVGKKSRYWSDYELLVDYGNKALNKMFLKIRKLIIDSNSAMDLQNIPLCVIPLVAGIFNYATSSKIIEIRQATVTKITDPVNNVTMIVPVDVMTTAEMDQKYYGWRSFGAGDPRAVITDLNTDSLSVWPVPVANVSPPPATLTPTINLTVSRFMLRRFSMVEQGGKDVPDDTVILTFREEYHDNLVAGILAEAYMKDDGETRRLDLATANEKKFMARNEEISEELSRQYRVNRGVRCRKAYM